MVLKISFGFQQKLTVNDQEFILPLSLRFHMTLIKNVLYKYLNNNVYYNDVNPSEKYLHKSSDFTPCYRQVPNF